MFFIERGFIMYFDVFNTIVFDNENDLMLCVDDDYVRAAMTLDEIAKIVPRVKKIMDAKTFDEILNWNKVFSYCMEATRQHRLKVSSFPFFVSILPLLDDIMTLHLSI